MNSWSGGGAVVSAHSHSAPEGRAYTEAEWDELLRALLLQEVDKHLDEPEPEARLGRLEHTLLGALAELRREVVALRREVAVLRAAQK